MKPEVKGNIKLYNARVIATLWAIAHQTPLFLALQADTSHMSHQGSPFFLYY